MTSVTQKQFANIINQEGLATVLKWISDWSSDNPEKMSTGGFATKTKKSRKKKTPKTKKALLELLNETHPEWKLGKGKGLSIAALKNALETDEKPEPKKRTNPYFTFLAIVRDELSDRELTSKQIIRIGSRRWTILKAYASENDYTEKDIIEDRERLAEVAKKFSSIEEDLEGMPEPKAKKPKQEKKKKVVKKSKDKVGNADESEDISNTHVAGMFDMSDSDDDDDDSE